jgi:threonine/homoserine/homoserine lactone efflux protein
MHTYTLVGFALTFFVFAASPGPDNLTIFMRTIAGGLRAGFAYGLGTVTGILVFLSVGAFGFSYLAALIGPFMVVLRYVGALYLIWMGLSLWFRPASDAGTSPAATSGNKDILSTYLTGVALNLGNPKMPLFYLAILPNVVGPSLTPADLLQLLAVILAIEAVVIGFYAGLAVKARGLASRPTFLRRLNKAAGGVMAATGAAILANR